MNWSLLANSVILGTSVTLVALAFGLCAALWIAALGPRARSIFLLAAAASLAFPPFLVTNSWIYLLGHTGVWHEWLPFNIYSLKGAVWILSLMLWPIALLLILANWQKIEPSQFESDPALCGWPLIRWLLLPHARPALIHAGLLIFVLAFNNFAVPAILQTKVYPAELWVSFNTTFDYGAAVRLGWPLLLVPALFLLWIRRHEAGWPRLEGSLRFQVFRRQLGRGWFLAAGALSLAIIGLAFVLPLAQLAISSRTWSELPSAFSAGRSALLNSLFSAGLTATFCLVLGLASRHWGFGRLLWLFFLVPGIVLGIGLIAISRPVLDPIFQSLAIVVLALLIRYSALGWTGASQAMQSVDPDLHAAALLQGASGWQRFRHVDWPQIAHPLAAVWYLIYLLCLWDVESLVLLLPPGGETLASRIFNLLHYGHNTQVDALCLLLLAAAVSPLAFWLLTRRPGRAGILVLGIAIVAAATGAGCGSSGGAGALKSEIFARVEIIGSRGAGLGFFNKPRSVAVDSADNLYVVDMTGRVQKFSPDGQFLSSWQMQETDKGNPKGMCRDESGNIVVIEPHYSRINHFSPDGKLVRQWGNPGTDPGQVMFPRAAAVDGKGAIYVSEYGVVERVQKFTADGTRCLATFGKAGTGPGEFNRPEGLGIDPDGRLFVADSCNHRIQIFSPDGKFLSAFGKAGSRPGEMSYPYDVQVDEKGRQYVCEFGNSRIQVFDEHSKPLEIIGGPGAEPGQFHNPWGIAIDSKGNLYVADSRNHRVQKFIRRHERHSKL